MDDKLFQELKTKYPNTYKNLTHIECDDGWYELLSSLSSVIENEIMYLPEEIKDQVYAEQIKSKFATLRYYMSHAIDSIEGAISMAETMSAKICEFCGLPGKSHNLGWLFTLCDSCLEKEKERRNKLKGTT